MGRVPLKGTMTVLRASSAGTPDAQALQSPAQHVRMGKLARRPAFSPPIARAQCNEGGIERQPFSDISGRLHRQCIHASMPC
jgi:hypothetical protein